MIKVSKFFFKCIFPYLKMGVFCTAMTSPPPPPPPFAKQFACNNFQFQTLYVLQQAITLSWHTRFRSRYLNCNYLPLSSTWSFNYQKMSNFINYV